MNQSPSQAGVGQLESGGGVALPSMAVQLSEQIACVEREIGMRERHYPRWVRDKKLTQTAADLELSRMRGVLQSLVALKTASTMNVAEREAVRVAERERVLAIVARHMHSSSFTRVEAKARAPL